MPGSRERRRNRFPRSRSRHCPRSTTRSSSRGSSSPGDRPNAPCAAFSFFSSTSFLRTTKPATTSSAPAARSRSAPPAGWCSRSGNCSPSGSRSPGRSSDRWRHGSLARDKRSTCGRKLKIAVEDASCKKKTQVELRKVFRFATLQTQPESKLNAWVCALNKRDNQLRQQCSILKSNFMKHFKKKEMLNILNVIKECHESQWLRSQSKFRSIVKAQHNIRLCQVTAGTSDNTQLQFPSTSSVATYDFWKVTGEKYRTQQQINARANKRTPYRNDELIASPHCGHTLGADGSVCAWLGGRAVATFERWGSDFGLSLAACGTTPVEVESFSELARSPEAVAPEGPALLLETGGTRLEDGGRWLLDGNGARLATESSTGGLLLVLGLLECRAASVWLVDAAVAPTTLLAVVRGGPAGAWPRTRSVDDRTEIRGRSGGGATSSGGSATLTIFWNSLRRNTREQVGEKDAELHQAFRIPTTITSMQKRGTHRSGGDTKCATSS